MLFLFQPQIVLLMSPLELSSRALSLLSRRVSLSDVSLDDRQDPPPPPTHFQVDFCTQETPIGITFPLRCFDRPSSLSEISYWTSSSRTVPRRSSSSPRFLVASWTTQDDALVSCFFSQSLLSSGIRQLQCILLKVALLLGVEIHESVAFEELCPPPEDQSISEFSPTEPTKRRHSIIYQIILS